MICPRGFLLIRNMQSGELRPFFLKVREEDIIRRGDIDAEVSDRVTPSYDNGWFIEKHTAYNRINMYRRLAVPQLTRSSTRKASTTISLPEGVLPASAVITVGIDSNDIQLLENSHFEVNLVDPSNVTGLSTTLKVELINPSGNLTDTNVTAVSGARLMIDIKGFSEDPANYDNT